MSVLHATAHHVCTLEPLLYTLCTVVMHTNYLSQNATARLLLGYFLSRALAQLQHATDPPANRIDAVQYWMGTGLGTVRTYAHCLRYDRSRHPCIPPANGMQRVRYRVISGNNLRY